MTGPEAEADSMVVKIVSSESNRTGPKGSIIR